MAVIILPKNTEYVLGNDFPIITIPMTMENAESSSFEDFQWWAKSDDFANWLKANPRQWVADSEDLSKYTGNLTEYLRECRERYDEESLISESNVISFADFERMVSESAHLFEDGDAAPVSASGDDQTTVKDAVKFHFAYNSLKSKGILKESTTAEQIATGDAKAVFLVLEDPESKENLLETLKAYKMEGYAETSAESKFTLINTTEMVPGGPVSIDDTPEDIIGRVVQDATILATTAGAGVLIFGALKIAGGAIGTRVLLKTIQGFSPASAAARAAAAAAPGFWSKAGKFTSGKIKSIWGIAKEMAILKNTRIAVQAASRGFKGAKAAYTLGKVGVGAAVKAFGKGFSRGFTKAGGKAIPFVGEVLMVIDAVGSIWNWYSNNQAPRFSEVESFAHISMNPGEIPIGVPITVCWSQPAGGWGGAAVSFLFSNETRTTCELVKIAVKDNDSIFILTQVNSKEVQKQLASHDIVLIALDNSDIVNDQAEDATNPFVKIAKSIQRTFDNEDMDFKLSFVDGIDKVAALFNFQGICDWSAFMTEYNNSSDQLILSDENAPGTYQFYYTDSEDNIINVAGRLITSEELANMSDSDLEKVFYPTEGGEDVFGKIKKKGEEEVVEESEDFNSAGLSVLMESSDVITSFSDFNSSLTKANLGIFEVDEPEGNPEEGTGDVDAQGPGSDTASLSTEDKMEPAKVAIYKVTDREYANPSLRKYKAGVFTQFILTGESYEAKANESIGVDVNTTGEDLEDPKRGVYAYKRKEDTPIPVVIDDPNKDKNDDLKRDQQPDLEKTEDKPDDNYFLKADPKDVEIKDKRNSTVIRDKNVGGGINIMDEFLDNKKKEILGIPDWKAISFAKSMMDAKGEVTEVKLKNRFAAFGDKTRRYSVTDGEKFEIAKKFAEEVEARIKYQ